MCISLSESVYLEHSQVPPGNKQRPDPLTQGVCVHYGALHFKLSASINAKMLITNIAIVFKFKSCANVKSLSVYTIYIYILYICI